jgi:hypothetical protein
MVRVPKREAHTLIGQELELRSCRNKLPGANYQGPISTVETPLRRLPPPRPLS